METKLSDVLEKKSGKIISVSPDSTVYDTITKMAEHRIGAILVIENDKLKGIFTERDYMSKIILQGLSSRETAVKDVMTWEVVFVTTDTTVDEALSVMTEKRCRHLPIFDNKQLVGIVSIGDLVKRMITDQQVTIQYLTEYIQGY